MFAVVAVVVVVVVVVSALECIFCVSSQACVFVFGVHAHVMLKMWPKTDGRVKIYYLCMHACACVWMLGYTNTYTHGCMHKCIRSSG